MPPAQLAAMLFSLGLVVLGAALATRDGALGTMGSSYIRPTHGFWVAVIGLALLIVIGLVGDRRGND